MQCFSRRSFSSAAAMLTSQVWAPAISYSMHMDDRQATLARRLMQSASQWGQQHVDGRGTTRPARAKALAKLPLAAA